MPRFYFHHWSSGQLLADPEGSEFEDLDAAREEAVRGARCLLSGDIKRGCLDLDQRFELADEAGTHVLTVAFVDTIDFGPSRGREALQQSDQSRSLKHALVIEDEIFVAMIIENALKDLGYGSVVIAMTEDEAVAAAEERCPDLITSDVYLATGNGIDAIAKICSERDIPVVFVTASKDQVHKRDTSAIVVEKPFGIPAFCDAIDQATRSIQAA